MIALNRQRLGAVTVCVVLLPGGVFGQTVASSFEELESVVNEERVGRGTTIRLTDISGRTVTGKLTMLNRRSISLAVDGRTQIFAESGISEIRMADGLGNGTLIGAGVGLGTALGILAAVGSGEGYVVSSAQVAAPLVFTGAGALVGALIDRAHEGGRVLYVSPGQTRSTAVSPLLAHGRRGVLVSISF